MARVEVNSDALFAAGDKLGALAMTTENLATELSGLNNRIDFFLGSWLTEAGRSASVMVLESRQFNDALNGDLARLCQQVAQVAASYSGAEEYAVALLQKYEAGGVNTGWASDARPALSIESITSANLAFYFDAASRGYKNLSKILDGTPIGSLSYVAARGMYGTSKYMDSRVAQGNVLWDDIQREDSIKRISSAGILTLGFDLAFKAALPWLNRKTKEYSMAGRQLEHSEMVDDEQVKKEVEGLVLPVTAEAVTRNMRIAESTGDRIDELMKGQGRVEEYQGIVVQVVENEDGTETAYVYVTGTDPYSSIFRGEPASIAENPGELSVNPNMPLSDASPSMQLIEQALQKMGVTDSMGIVVVGFSKGAATAVNFVNNKEAQGKYKMQGVIDIGGPTGKLEVTDPSIAHVKIADNRDPVNGVGGSYGKDKENMHIIVLENDDDFSSHSIDGYKNSVADNMMANVSLAASVGLVRPVATKNARAVAGSTQPKGKTETELKAYATAGKAAALYDMVDYAEEFFPQEIEIFGKKIETRWKVPNAPDVPTVVTEENTAGEYFEAAYKIKTGQDWDSTPPTLNLSPDHFKEHEKSYNWTVGSENLPHLEISIDSGEYSIDVDWGPWGSDSSDEEQDKSSGFDKAYRGIKKVLPQMPEDVWEVPQDPPSQHPEPQYEYVAPAQPAPVETGVDDSERVVIEFAPAPQEYESVGGNF